MSVSYTIEVYTGDVSYAGTDANVSIILYGDKGLSPTLTLDDDRNNFERGDRDVFTHELDDLGDIDKIKIWHDNSNAGAAWFLDRIVVRNNTKNKSYTFYCSEWLEGTGGKNIDAAEKPDIGFYGVSLYEEELGFSNPKNHNSSRSPMEWTAESSYETTKEVKYENETNTTFSTGVTVAGGLKGISVEVRADFERSISERVATSESNRLATTFTHKFTLQPGETLKVKVRWVRVWEIGYMRRGDIVVPYKAVKQLRGDAVA